jgi:hypothetical protein
MNFTILEFATNRRTKSQYSWEETFMKLRQIMALAIVISSAMLIQLACGKDSKGTGGGTNNASLIFTREPANEPVVLSGRVGWPIFPTDPCVIADAEGYHLFYTSYFCKASGSYYYSWDVANMAACNITQVVATVGYAFSADRGFTWQFRGRPIVLPGPEPWQSGDLETPFVAILGDTVYLLYSATGTVNGQPFPQRYQIGAATLNLHGHTLRQSLLENDAEFVRLPQPLLPYNTEVPAFNNNTQEPSVVIRNNRLELYYVGLRLSDPRLPAEAPGQEILGVGLARAIFATNLALIEATNGYILPNANIPEVKYFDSAYYVFATAAGNGEFHRQEKIDYYFSKDGTTFSKPVDLLAPQVSFDAWGIMAPTLVIEKDTIVMFYSGWSYADHPCFPEPLPLDVRFGRPSNNDAACIFGAFGRAVAVRSGTH